MEAGALGFAARLFAAIGIATIPFPAAEVLKSPHVTVSFLALALASVAAIEDARRRGSLWEAFRPSPFLAIFLAWLPISFAAGRLLGRVPGGLGGEAGGFARDFLQIAFLLGVASPALAWILRDTGRRLGSALVLALAFLPGIALALLQFADPWTPGESVVGTFLPVGEADVRAQGNAHLHGLEMAAVLPALFAIAPAARGVLARAGLCLLFAAGAYALTSFGPFAAVLVAAIAAGAARGRRELAIAAAAALLLLSFPSKGPRTRGASLRDSLFLFETVDTPPPGSPADALVVVRGRGESLAVARRFVRWTLHANQAAAFFPFGSGLGCSEKHPVQGFRDLEIPKPGRLLDRRDPYTEHTYLQLAAETGPPGAALFLLWLLSAMRAGFLRFRDEADPAAAALGLAAFAGLLGLAIGGVFAPLLNRFTLPLLALLAAWARPRPAERPAPPGGDLGVTAR